MSVVVVLVAMLAACVSEPESSDSPVSAPQVTQAPTAWYEPSTGAQQARLRDGRAARRFTAMNPGAWDIDFDPVLETARSVRGSGEMVGDPVAFATQHADLFGATELVLDGSVTSGDVTQISLAQQHHGVPVIGGQLGLSIAQGRLVLVQGSTYPIDDLDVEPGIDADAAIAAAEPELERRADATTRLAILPERDIGNVTYRLVWEVTTHDNVRVHVDATSGEVVAAYDNDRYDYLGSAWSSVDERTVGSPIVSVPNLFNTVTVSGFPATVSDANGNFRVTSTATDLRTVTSTLRGTHVAVINMGGSSASFSGNIIPSQPAAVTWSSAVSTLEERDAFRAVNATNRFVAAVFPSVSWIENTQVPVKVNLNQTCNAFWDGSAINTMREGNGCNNTGRIFDVVAHEWAHGLDQNLPGGVQDAALGEFIGDLVAFTQTDDPIVAPGYRQDGTPMRDMNDPAFQCYDPSFTEIHVAGQLLGAVVWDIHEDLERAGVTGAPLVRRMLLPIATAQTRAQWYSAMLVADDNDGNLANGTPNECLIYRQFEAHSCGATRFPGMPASPPVGCVSTAPAPTTTTLVASANPTAVGQPVVFTADVSSTTAPAGYINLSVDGWTVQYALVSPVNATTSRATFSFPTMAQGSHTVVADFAPTSNHRPSNSATLAQTVYCAFTGATASPSVLSTGAWGSFVPVQIGVTTACDATRFCAISDVIMNETDFRPLGDWTITSALGVSLRRERWGYGTGRIYDVEVTCNDGIVAPSTLHAFVSVPR